jgi:hypothetical protein
MMPQLEALSFSGYNMVRSHNDVSNILLSVVSSRLRFLDFDNVKISPDSLSGTFQCAPLLTSLEFQDDAALNEGVFEILAQRAPETLERLFVAPDAAWDDDEEEYSGPIAPMKDEHLLGIISRVRRLKALRLRRCTRLTDESVGLAVSKYAGSLQELDLSFDELLTDGALEGFAEVDNGLKVLDLDPLLGVTDAAIVPLLTRNRNKKLWDLNLRKKQKSR